MITANIDFDNNFESKSHQLRLTQVGMTTQRVQKSRKSSEVLLSEDEIRAKYQAMLENLPGVSAVKLYNLQKISSTVGSSRSKTSWVCSAIVHLNDGPTIGCKEAVRLQQIIKKIKEETKQGPDSNDPSYLASKARKDDPKSWADGIVKTMNPPEFDS